MRHALLFSALFALSGCGGARLGQPPADPEPLTTGPDYVRWLPRDFQPAPLPTATSQAPAQPPALQPRPAERDQLPRPAQNWWTEFGSSELDELVETALANNFDLRAAVARIEQAENQARIIDAARVPSIDFFAGMENRGPAGGVGTATTRQDWNTRNIYQAGLRVNYEADLWGRQGAEARSALEQARANVFNREVVALTLVAETSAAYFQYLSLSERIAIAENNRKLAQEVADAIDRRLRRGDASLVEQQQQQIAVALLDNNLANLRLQRERLLTRLSVYLGKPPGMIKLKQTTLQGIKLPLVSPGLPSELLCRRPDIRQAEAQLAAANADVQAARANLLPSVALTGQFGQGSFNLAELLSPQSLLYSLAGNLSATVFDGERKENRVAQTRARNRELLENYARTVLSALRDVEDALAGIRLTQQQQQALAQALQRNSRLLEMSQRIYKLGALDYISLLDLQRNVYLAQDTEASARFEQVRSSIDLFKALGGGVTDQPKDPCTTGAAPTAASTTTPAPAPATPTATAATPATTPAPAPTPASSSPPASAPLPPPGAVRPPPPAGRTAVSPAARAAALQAEREAEQATQKPAEPAK